jgi:hypothetical protein
LIVAEPALEGFSTAKTPILVEPQLDRRLPRTVKASMIAEVIELIRLAYLELEEGVELELLLADEMRVVQTEELSLD